MNNPNPFVPRGSLLEKQSQRRSGLKLAVFCVLAVSVTGLTAMLIQGCKRTVPEEQTPPPFDTNAFPPMDTNYPPMTDVSNPPVTLPPLDTVAPVPPPPTAPVVPEPIAPTAGSEYTVVKGDTLAGIAKNHGISLAALQAANPGVIPTKLKIGQKLVIPAASTSSAAAPMSASGDTGGTIYTVKNGDTLTRIAKKYGTTVKAIQTANNLITTRIKVGQKLKIPSKVESAPAAAAPAPAAPAPAPAPVVDTAPAPALPPLPVQGQ